MIRANTFLVGIVLTLAALAIYYGYTSVKRRGIIAAAPEAKREPQKSTEADVCRFIEQGDMISAIRCYSKISGLGLKDSRNAVDQLAQEIRRLPPSQQPHEEEEEEEEEERVESPGRANTNFPERISILVPAGFLMLSALMFLIGWKQWTKTRDILRQSAYVTGTVLSIHEEHSSRMKKGNGGARMTEESTAYYPTIRFTQENGTDMTFKSTTAIEHYTYEVGDPIKVVYNRLKPEQAVIDSDDSLYGGMIVACILGCAFVLAAGLVYFLPTANGLWESAVASAAFFIIGCGLLPLVWCVGREELYLKSLGRPGTAMVVDFTDREMAILEYTPEGGRIRRFISCVSSNPPKYQIGDTVPILYHPKEPHRARINSFEEMWIGIMITGGLSLAFLGASFAIASFELYTASKVCR